MTQERILIVEDESPVADALHRVLRLPQAGSCQVVTCSSGEEALAVLSKSQMDLIITDLSMPGMDGLEMLERARQISPSTRSILITAYGSADVEYQARNLANVYLPKPFSLQDFLQAVHQALTAPQLPLLPVMILSEQGLQALQKRLEQLRADTGALNVLLPDWSGQLLVECGQQRESHTDVLLALLGNSMAAATEVARRLNEEDGFDLHYHEGKHFEVYAAMLSDTIFLALLFDRRAGGSRIGLVSLYMRRAMEDLRGLLSNALLEPSQAWGLQPDLASAMRDALDDSFDLAPPGNRPSNSDGLNPGNTQADAADTSKPGMPAPELAGSGASETLLTFEQAQSLGLLNPSDRDAM